MTTKETIKQKRLRKKYPDTDYFHFNNPNPKTNITSDCVFRAISIALMQPWEKTHRDMFEIAIREGYTPTSNEVIDIYLKQEGWVKHKQPRHDYGSRYTGFEFLLAIGEQATYYNIIANIGAQHMVAIVNGKINDTWNSSEYCIGNYWTQDKEPLILGY